MDTKKFEQLIDLIINENEEDARVLFHDIVIEKSRMIYETIMDQEMEEGMELDEVGGLMDEIADDDVEGDISGMGGMGDEMSMDDESTDFSDEEDVDFDDEDSEDFGDEEDEDLGDEEEGGLEDRLVNVEDKLDELMAEFEELMGQEDEEDAGEEDAGEEDEEDFGDEEDAGEEDTGEEDEESEEEPMAESVSMKTVKKPVHPTTYAKSPTAFNSGKKGAVAQPSKMGGKGEADPRSAKSPSNYGTKGQMTVKGHSDFRNLPARDNGSKGASAPKAQLKPKSEGNKHSVIESKKSTKKIVK